MKCPECGSTNLKPNGKIKTRKEQFRTGGGKQQYLCKDCGHRTLNPIEEV